MEWLDLLGSFSNYGVAIVFDAVLLWLLYKNITEEKKAAVEREASLISANNRTVEVLNEVAESITRSDTLNNQLSETNRLLVEKIDGRLENIDTNLKRLMDKTQ